MPKRIYYSCYSTCCPGYPTKPSDACCDYLSGDYWWVSKNKRKTFFNIFQKIFNFNRFRKFFDFMADFKKKVLCNSNSVVVIGAIFFVMICVFCVISVCSSLCGKPNAVCKLSQKLFFVFFNFYNQGNERPTSPTSTQPTQTNLQIFSSQTEIRQINSPPPAYDSLVDGQSNNRNNIVDDPLPSFSAAISNTQPSPVSV